MRVRTTPGMKEQTEIPESLSSAAATWAISFEREFADGIGAAQRAAVELRPPCAQRQVGSGPAQGEGRGAPDAEACSGNDSDAAGQTFCHRGSLTITACRLDRSAGNREMLRSGIEPMNSVISAYEKIAPDYEGILESIYQFAPRQIDGFFSRFPKAGEVLDAGCGPGFESAVGARHGLVMTGLDACEPMLLRFRVRTFLPARFWPGP